MHTRWKALEELVHGDEDRIQLPRTRARWSRVHHGSVQREIGETGHEHLGLVEGVRAVVAGPTPVREPLWHKNVLGIDTRVHIEERDCGLMIVQIDRREIETLSIERFDEGTDGNTGEARAGQA